MIAHNRLQIEDEMICYPSTTNRIPRKSLSLGATPQWPGQSPRTELNANASLAVVATIILTISVALKLSCTTTIASIPVISHMTTLVFNPFLSDTCAVEV